MVERVDQLTGESGKDVWVSTFHSCCARILRRDIEKLGYKREFVIYDEDDRMSVIRGVAKSLELSDKEYPPKVIKATISDAKNRMLTPKEWLQDAGDNFRNRKLMEAYQKYEITLKGNNALDFDDLLIKTLELLVGHPPVLQYYQDKFDYVLVDEYQDTNAAQYQFVRLMTGNKRNLCVVGDDDQSIYGWRGADIRNILDFEKDFPDCRTIKLEQNYRSSGNILDAANQVIAHNAGRKEKVLWTQSDTGDKIGLYHAMDERDEAAFAALMSKKLMNQGTRPGEIAEVAWIPMEEAEGLLTHDNDKRVLSLAIQYVEERNGKSN
jgi:DNA helicase-2/ATP-dependent DNA helicase PcrA